MYSPIAKELVAAGEGALITWIILLVSLITKSSTNQPSADRAWARTPAGLDEISSAVISGTSFWRAFTNAPLKKER